jgi:hypothetical protein
MKLRLAFGTIPKATLQLLPKGLHHFSYLRRGATWRSGYATVCKTDRFAFCVSAHSEKIAKSSPNYINRLAGVSERREAPAATGRAAVRQACVESGVPGPRRAPIL